MLRASREDARQLHQSATDVEHARLLRIGCEVLPRVQEHTVDSVPFVNLPFLECAKIRKLHAVGHGGNLLVELGGLILIRVLHVSRNARQNALQEPADVLDTRLRRRT